MAWVAVGLLMVFQLSVLFGVLTENRGVFERVPWLSRFVGEHPDQIKNRAIWNFFDVEEDLVVESVVTNRASESFFLLDSPVAVDATNSIDWSLLWEDNHAEGDWPALLPTNSVPDEPESNDASPVG